MSGRVEVGRWKCEHCGTRFDREKSGNRPIRFCAVGCYHLWRKEAGITTGQFMPNQAPWNKNLKGIHLSVASEWKPGRESEKRVDVGTVAIRHRKRERHPRAFVKIAEPNIWRERAKIVWESHNGPIPKGLVIHHKDRNPLNDEIDNLEAMTRSNHAREHSQDRVSLRLQDAA